MPTEAAEDGVLVEDLVSILWWLLNQGQELSQEFEHEVGSVGSFTDSEELEEEFR